MNVKVVAIFALDTIGSLVAVVPFQNATHLVDWGRMEDSDRTAMGRMERARMGTKMGRARMGCADV